MTNDDVLTPAEAAASLGLHVETVREKIRLGVFPFAPVAEGGVVLPSPARRVRISAARWAAYVAGELTEENAA